jgi:hypothetical protein
MNISRHAMLAFLSLNFLTAVQAQAQFNLPTWHDIERAVRPQDLPLHFRTPEETQTIISDPVFTETHYRIGFINKTSRPIRIECEALKDGKWIVPTDRYWIVKPYQQTWLLYHNQQAVLANKWRFRGLATDGSGLVWGNFDMKDVGPPYETNGGTRIYWESLTE